MNDLISRQAAIDKIREVYEYEFPTASGAFDEFVTVIIPNLLRNLPPAQRTGRWIDGKVKHIKNGELRNVRECSECGSSYFVYDYYNSVDEIPKFCPNCGCAMKGEEE